VSPERAVTARGGIGGTGAASPPSNGAPRRRWRGGWRSLAAWRVPIVATCAALAFLLVQSVGQYFYGESRVPASVSAQLARSGKADIAVRLGFVPESFNLTYLSGEGNVAQTKGDTVYMNGVPGSSVRAIAGQYWVRAVTSWNGS